MAEANFDGGSGTLVLSILLVMILDVGVAVVGDTVVVRDDSVGLVDVENLVRGLLLENFGLKLLFFGLASTEPLLNPILLNTLSRAEILCGY